MVHLFSKASDTDPSIKISPRKPWAVALLGCVVLPVNLPFVVPGVCRTKPAVRRSAPTRVIKRQRRVIRRPARVITPQRRVIRQPTRVIRQPAPAPQRPIATNTNSLEGQVQAEINRIRRSSGLRPLRGNGQLAQVARRHSKNMASRSFFGHRDHNGQQSYERALGAGIRFRYIAENLAWNNSPSPVALAVKGWMKSPTHRRNILSPEARETGVGIARRGDKYFLTQLFMAR